MTTVQNIPEELLLVILSNLSGRDLIQCQHVCRAWYIPARVKFLNKKVILRNTTKIRRFITAINRNSNSRFLAAVKEIEASYTKAEHVNGAALNNLFFRFPNLESVSINEVLLNKFNDNVCRAVLHCCPKLADMRMRNYYAENLQQLKNVRLLLTKLELGWEIVNNIEQLVTSFPRLKSLCTFRQLKTLESLLPVLAHLSDLKEIKFIQFENGDNHFLERYLQLKTPDEQTRLYERISRISNLDIACTTSLSKYMLDFIAEYMTGLDSISIKSVLSNDPQQTQLYYTMLNMVRSIKHSRTITGIPVNIFWDCLPRFIHEVFQRPTKKKALDLYCMGSDSSARINVETNTTDTWMRISLSDIHLYNRSTLFDGILEMDRFSLMAPPYSSKVSMKAYDAFFKTKSTFKEVTLEVPWNFIGEQEPLNDSIAENHTFVETLKILSEFFAPVQLLLDKCYVAFPNLKLLTFDGFWGTRMKDTRKYQLELPKFTLEKLVIDITSVYEIKEERKYILLEMEVLSLGDRYLYKVPFDSSEPTKLDEQDLSSTIPEEDYVLIQLTVGSLQNLKLDTKVNERLGTKLETKLKIQTKPATCRIVNKK